LGKKNIPTPASPFVNNGKVIFKREWNLNFIYDAWQNQFGIDITNLTTTDDKIREWFCEKTGVYFFTPHDFVLDSKGYSELQKLAWYYSPNKWEYDFAIKKFGNKPLKVLEIGCGEGSFIARCQDAGHMALGLELNEVAVEKATKRGLPVYNIMTDKFKDDYNGYFDIVCGFQVLEHIPNPYQFIQDCVSMLKPNGKLIFAVPNADGLLATDFNILDMPPHHATRWSKQAFQSLTDIFPLEAVEINSERLAPYHFHWYINIKTKTNPIFKLLFSSAIFQKLFLKYLKIIGKNFITGHTHIAIFKKHGNSR
jgi:2-polyprenyl-3-methyl-5-hydroxy-6-metoxy-1,4-benzoquinol methylase